MLMAAYTTLSEAVNDLQRRGYTDDLRVLDDQLFCTTKKVALDPVDFHIDEFHRFEGNTDPEDQSIVYAISSAKHNMKGILVNAFGPDASPVIQEMVRRLDTHG
jgi:hypothetical protein